MAARLLWSDPSLHEHSRPNDQVSRLLFDQLEQFRVESLVPASYQGVVANLRHRFRHWALNSHHAGLTVTESGLLLYSVAQICRARLVGEAVVDETEDLMEPTRAALAPIIGHDLAALTRHRSDQEVFAQHACSLANAVVEMIGAQQEETPRAAKGRGERALVALLDAADDDGEVVTPSAATQSTVDGSSAAYRVFSTDYDRQAHATSLVRPPLLREYRERLDTLVARQGLNLGRLTRELEGLLATPVSDGWNNGHEQGQIDGTALARMISSPDYRRLFRAERTVSHTDVLVTFVLDCSGSMKQHTPVVAVLVDTLARALESIGASCEILGFTTGAFNGGRAFKQWRRAGQPPHPGRLNERTHIVFKDADTTYRQARSGIAGLFKADLFREGIDGEAVQWAAARAADRTEARKILIVVSDGSPMDSATASTNDPQYLDAHLRRVVSDLEKAGQEIVGVGVGLDLSDYYSRSRLLDTSGATGHGMLNDVLSVLAR